MRALVRRISESARARDSDFIVVPQNGHDLLSSGLAASDDPSVDYLATIDGVGREDLYYGYVNDDEPTPASEREAILPFLQIARDAGKVVLVTDYCSTRARVDDSYARSAARGFVSFAADRRELDDIPEYPNPTPGANTSDVTRLGEVRNLLYLLNPGGFASRGDYLEALRGAPHDLLVIDAFFEGETLSSAEVQSLQRKPAGGRRLVLAYMSIGEAENYRDYWLPSWNVARPDFVVAENPDFAGNFVVEYWRDEWQSLILDDGGYLSRILDAGFDGAYLDIIDAFEFFESEQ